MTSLQKMLNIDVFMDNLYNPREWVSSFFASYYLTKGSQMDSPDILG